MSNVVCDRHRDTQTAEKGVSKKGPSGWGAGRWPRGCGRGGEREQAVQGRGWVPISRGVPSRWPGEPAVLGDRCPLRGVSGSVLSRVPACFSFGGPGGIASCPRAHAFLRLLAGGPFRPCWVPFGLGLYCSAFRTLS